MESHKSKKCKISAPSRNDNFELCDGLYSVLYIQVFFENISKKRGENINNPSIRINVRKNRQ